MGLDKKLKLGSFRGGPEMKNVLPSEIYADIFGEDSSSLDPSITIDPSLKGAALLNNGAFGRPYDAVQNLADRLRGFAATNPDLFYDQVCLGLVQHSYDVAEDFFKTKEIVLVPNCSMGMKCVLEALVKKNQSMTAAYLGPIYSSTKNLLQCFEQDGLVRKVLDPILPGGETGALTEEDPEIIYAELVTVYAQSPFDVLFCDETASQSGRILPLDVVTRFCQENSVCLVVDGTQSCQLFFRRDKKELFDQIDYFVLSTHKWICNIKTCGVVRCGRNCPATPNPPAISVGWEPRRAEESSIENVRSQFLWTGMLDSYIAYITLAKALQIFNAHGEGQASQASALLNKGFRDLLKVKPLLDDTGDNKLRTMNIFKLNSAQLEPLGDASKIQNVLQDYGVYVSVKQFGMDCGGSSCSKKVRRTFYLRVSCWSFNTEFDFETLAYTFTNNLRLSSSTNEAFKHQFTYIFDMYDKLFSVLKPEAFFIRAEKLRHHLIFYLAHTAVFYVNKLLISGNLKARVDPELESVMAVGVDEMSWDDLLEDNYVWSSMGKDQQVRYLEKVWAYRRQVRSLILSLLDRHPIRQRPIRNGKVHQGGPGGTTSNDDTSLHWIVLMGIEHEKIHLETSAVIIAQVPLDLIVRPPDRHQFRVPTFLDLPENAASWQRGPGEVPKNCLVAVPGGRVRMGKDHLEQDLYGWDNEFGHEEHSLEDFEASQMLVSNAEYLEFVLDGGYSEPRWWSPEGWRFVSNTKVAGPRFWVWSDGGGGDGINPGRSIQKKVPSRYRLMLEEVPMPWSFPVEVNNLEAEAFCNWKSGQIGKQVRLISHEEAFHMRQVVRGQTAVNFNLNSYASPTPVDLEGSGGLVEGPEEDGQVRQVVFDVCGNVWRHSVSVLTVMEGFRVDPYYDDFTMPIVDGLHNHLVGGSWISLGGYANFNFRNAFRRHFYQFAGIRYVCSRNNNYHKKVQKVRRGPSGVCQQLTEHYGNVEDHHPWGNDGCCNVKDRPDWTLNWPREFGRRAAQSILSETKLRRQRPGERFKVLVVHGGVGRSTLEILRGCSGLDVDHTDKTANHLMVLQDLMTDSKVFWYGQLEGEISVPMEFHLDDLDDEVVDRDLHLLSGRSNTLACWQSDSVNMRPGLGGYDAAVVDFRFRNASVNLAHIAARLKPGGLLILSSIDSPEKRPNLPGWNRPPGLGDLRQVLGSKFAPVGEEQQEASNPTKVSHLRRLTRNTCQYSESWFSVWRKRLDDPEAPAAPEVPAAGVSDPKTLISEATYDEVEEDPVQQEIMSTSDYYEDENIMDSYLRLHYSDKALLSVPNFPQQVARICTEACRKFGSGSGLALEAGCGPGRSALELSQVFDRVEAYDSCLGFVDVLRRRALKQGARNLKVFQGDAHHQLELCEPKKYDLILGCNLIDRLHSPKEWVLQSKLMLRSKGLLVISSPYTWMEEHTPRDNWIGGFKKNGENYSTADGLQELLNPELQLLETHRVPFVILDADGTYQYSHSICTIFGTK